MLSTFFPPGGLDPVLEGGVGDEDAVVAPQVPAGGLVGQTVLGHQPDSQLLDAAGVQAFGESQVGPIDAEVTTAVGAAMLGVGNHQINRAVGARVAQIVQGARGNSVATGAVTAAAATASRVVPASVCDTRLGKILDPGNALGDVGDVLAWAKHGWPSARNCPPTFILRMG